MSSQLALVKRDTVDVVAERVRSFQERGEIHFPANYSPENAMKSAWLMLQTIQTADKRPVLEACTKDSIANALLDMVVQGLNPAKKQGYFIPYGKTLTFQRSYFGTMAVTKNVTGAEDIDAQVIYQADEFDFEVVRGRKRITKHKSSFSNIDDEKIAGAYCTIFFADGTEYTEIMTMKEILKSWSKSKQSPDREGSTHKQFPGEMAKRTVINRACKAYMNSSDDSSLIMHHFQRQDEAITEAEVEAEIADQANGEVIDVTPEPVPAQQDRRDQQPAVGSRENELNFSDDVPPIDGKPGF